MRKIAKFSEENENIKKMKIPKSFETKIPKKNFSKIQKFGEKIQKFREKIQKF